MSSLPVYSIVRFDRATAPTWSVLSYLGRDDIRMTSRPYCRRDASSVVSITAVGGRQADAEGLLDE